MNQNLTIPLEIKKLSKRQFEGYGSVFGNVDYGGDVVVQGAFDQTLKDHKAKNSLPLMFWMHNPGQIPGKWLEMDEDSSGLYVKGELASTQLGDEVHTLLKMDAVRGMSIGYQTIDADYNNQGHRLIKEAELFEVSVVSLPMNPQAEVVHAKTRLSANGEYVPTHDEITIHKREVEQFLRHKGFSQRIAKKFVGDIYTEAEPSIITYDFDQITAEKVQEMINSALKNFSMTDVKSETETETTVTVEPSDDFDVTPELLELEAGANDFKEKLLLQDLQKRMRIFQ